MTPGDDPDPLYARMAATIREQIARGDLAPGARLPSERTLANEWGAARTTVRQALDLLRGEGLIVSMAGSGGYVRTAPPLRTRTVRHNERPRAGEPTSPFARDARLQGATPDWEWDTARVRAPEHVAARLGITAGEHTVRTTYLFRADGRPVQSSTSWEPYALTGGTDVEEPEGEGRITGVVARMDAIGVRVNRVVERPRARTATPAERAALAIPADVWVIQIERTYYAGARAVETADIVIPADRYQLEYEIPIP